MENRGTIRQRILEAARNIFLEHGYLKASMSEIASRAEINRPTLHYYFRTKDHMFEAVFGELIGGFLPRIELITGENVSLEQKIERITDEYVEVYRSNPDLPKFLLGEVNRDADRLIRMMESLGLHHFLESLQAMLDREKAHGNAKSVPMRFVVMTFFGQMTFPFLARNVVQRSCAESGQRFDEFIWQWRDSVVAQMKALLLN